MRKAINFQSLSAQDKKLLKQLLERKKKALEDALSATESELADLQNKPAAKKAAKKAKR